MSKPKNKVGRPQKIGDVELQKLETAFKFGSNNEKACSHANIPESTFYEYLKKHPEFSEKIKRWKDNPTLKALYTMYQNLDDPKWASWWLERKCKDEFNTVQTLAINNNSMDEFMKGLEKIRKK